MDRPRGAAASEGGVLSGLEAPQTTPDVGSVSPGDVSISIELARSGRTRRVARMESRHAARGITPDHLRLSAYIGPWRQRSRSYFSLFESRVDSLRGFFRGSHVVLSE